MRLAFVILAHNDPDNVLRLVKKLSTQDDQIVIHWDKNSRLDLQALAQTTLTHEQKAHVHFCRRVAVAWGRWSVVEATLAALKKVQSLDGAFDYVVLLSGSDYLLRPVTGLKAFLSRHPGKEFIECVDPEQTPWVVKGLVKERFLHHHWFSWRNQRLLFDWSLATQKKLGLKRKLPGNLKPYFGSQWWALTGATVQKVLMLSQKGTIRRFFQSTWVPDEMFFQTLVAAVAPQESIHTVNLTFYHFDHTGKPLLFYNDHFNFLQQQNFFFVRKLSCQAHLLRDKLDHFMADNPTASVAYLAKNMDEYNPFIAVQWRGIPNRRVMGRQTDAWYGDLEWNKTPYFVILAYPQAQLQPLIDELNTLPGIHCFGDLFIGDRIEYGSQEWAHPLYPADKPALRDMKRPNFLVDLIKAHPEHLLGCVMRLPVGNEMERIVLYDPQASIVFILPEDAYLPEDQHPLNWQCAFQNMIMHDHINEARQANKPFLAINTRGHVIAHESIVRLKHTLLALRDSPVTPTTF